MACNFFFFFFFFLAILLVTTHRQLQPPTMSKDKNKKKGKATKLGAPDHFTGFKKAFLVSQAATYQQCLDTKTTTAFYNKVTLDFIVKYGQQEPFHQEFVEDLPDPEDCDEDESEEIPLSEGAAAENAVLLT